MLVGLEKNLLAKKEQINVLKTNWKINSMIKVGLLAKKLIGVDI